jgi:RNA polymerase-associated protein
MTLFSDDACPQSHRARIVLAEKNITFEVQSVDPAHLPEDLLDLNPYGSIPTLVDRDLVLYEPRIIMEYLDERFPHPPLMPVDPVSRARSRLLMYRIEKDWYELLPDLESRSEKKAGNARNQLKEGLKVIAPVFEQTPYFMSEDFTLVDCSMAPILWRLKSYGIAVPPKARALQAYAERLFERDSFRSSLTEREREMND